MTMDTFRNDLCSTADFDLMSFTRDMAGKYATFIFIGVMDWDHRYQSLGAQDG